MELIFKINQRTDTSQTQWKLMNRVKWMQFFFWIGALSSCPVVFKRYFLPSIFLDTLPSITFFQVYKKKSPLFFSFKVCVAEVKLFLYNKTLLKTARERFYARVLQIVHCLFSSSKTKLSIPQKKNAPILLLTLARLAGNDSIALFQLCTKFPIPYTLVVQKEQGAGFTGKVIIFI